MLFFPAQHVADEGGQDRKKAFAYQEVKLAGEVGGVQGSEFFFPRERLKRCRRW